MASGEPLNSVLVSFSSSGADATLKVSANGSSSGYEEVLLTKQTGERGVFDIKIAPLGKL